MTLPLLTPLPVNRLPTLWRKARWADAEPAVQQLLSLLPLLPVNHQQQAWQAWQTIWQTASQPGIASPHSAYLSPGQTVKPLLRRKLDAVPFSSVLLTQLKMVSTETRAQWVKQVLILLQENPVKLKPVLKNS